MRGILLAAAGLVCLAVLSVGVAGADCADSTVLCVKIVNGKIFNNGASVNVGRMTVGNCWKNWSCKFCSSEATIAGQCNSRFAACEGNCAMCVTYVDTGGIAGPCYDKNGTKLLDAAPTGF